MRPVPDWPAVVAALQGAGIAIDSGRQPRPQSGGDINAAWQLDTGDGPLFLKTGPADVLEHYRAERDALAELAGANVVRVPQPRCVLSSAGTAVLALEWLDLGPASDAAHAAFGRQLAALHRVTANQFGWHRDNVIGRTPQPNPHADEWVAFYRDHRLRHQLDLAKANGFDAELQEEGAWLCERLGDFFAGYRPQPSLLHGDLWGGNWACCNGEPVMFDPASYFGDREMDLAMTRLFGGFRPAFYAAYEDAWPLSAGAGTRVALYQLYHVLNHLNLFGGGYAAQALQLIAGLRRHLLAG